MRDLGRAGIGGFAALMAFFWVFQTPLAGQEAKGPVKHSSPKTAWGDPDLQGIWTTWDETPLQSPNPDPVAREAERKARAEFDGPDGLGTNGGLGGGMSRIHFSPVSKRRQSLVVDPSNGRIPVVAAKVKAPTLREMGDTWENHSAWARCITHGVPGRLLQGGTGGYDKGYQILQTPGYVVFFLEEIHETRIIPVDGRKRLGQDIRLWNGSSRGHWEGPTLVVETTNFNGKGDGQGGVSQTEALRLVEHFTRVDHNTLKYEVTFDDPKVYSQPWTAMQPHNLDPKYVIHEYACHEGNTRYMEDSLQQGRLRDAEEAAKKSAKP